MPLGQIELPITFGEWDNLCMENVIFDIAHFYLPYKAILGHLVLAKLSMAVHYTYGMVKIPGPSSVIFVKSDTKGTVYAKGLCQSCTRQWRRHHQKKSDVLTPEATGQSLAKQCPTMIS